MTSRIVYLGTKPVNGLDYVATHWAIRVGDDSWWEIDGGSGNNESVLFKNTINTGLWDVFGKLQKGPVGKVHKGTIAKSGATAVKEVGKTTKSNHEIDVFNQMYIEQHPEYNFTTDNCQHYVYSLVKMLVGDTSKLPMLETRKTAMMAGAAVVGVAALAGFLNWLYPPEEEKEEEEKDKQIIKKSEEKSKNLQQIEM